MKRLFALGTVALLMASLVGCSGREPASVPEVEPMTTAAREASYAEHVSAERDRLESMHPEVVVPEVDRVRYVTPEEWAPALAACLTSEGFETTTHADGGIRVGTIPPEQAEAQAIAVFSCSLRYPVDPQHAVPLNDDQLYYLYDYFLSELVPCLEESGYSISAAPTWQVFQETFHSAPWSPYDDVSPIDEGDWLAINEDCPQQPEQLIGPGT